MLYRQPCIAQGGGTQQIEQVGAGIAGWMRASRRRAMPPVEALLTRWSGGRGSRRRSWMTCRFGVPVNPRNSDNTHIRLDLLQMSLSRLVGPTLQLASAPAMRGRAMALWSVAFIGSTPVGGPIIGWIAENTGPRWALAVGAAAALLATGPGNPDRPSPQQLPPQQPPPQQPPPQQPLPDTRVGADDRRRRTEQPGASAEVTRPRS